VAIDKYGNIVGVIIAKTSVLMDFTWTEKVIDFMFGGGWEEWVGEMIWKMCWWFRWLLPSYYANWTQGTFNNIFSLLDYDENKIMTEMESNKMWIISILCVDKKYRNQKIATNLVKSGMKLAKKYNCDSSAVIVSNIYSERIFTKEYFEPRKRIPYDKIRDKRDKKILNDTQEHENVTLMTRRLKITNLFMPD